MIVKNWIKWGFFLAISIGVFLIICLAKKEYESTFTQYLNSIIFIAVGSYLLILSLFNDKIERKVRKILFFLSVSIVFCGVIIIILKSV